jgi:hypothetical protein
MTVSVLFLVGRFVFVVPFVLLGVDRIPDGEATAAVRAWATLGLLGAAGVALGAWGDVAALVLALAVFGAEVSDGRDEGAGADARLASVGLLGGALCVAALYAAVGAALDLTLTDPVLDLDLR